MATPQERLVALDKQIREEGYFVGMWLACIEGKDLPKLSDAEVCTLTYEFWLALPDSPSIRGGPFWELCDLCEGSYLGIKEFEEDNDAAA